MNSPVAYVGIDPGKTGCFCLLSGNVIRFFDWPKNDDLQLVAQKVSSLAQAYNIIMAGLERVHAMPKQGVNSMFTFGRNYGQWQMLLAVLKLPHVLISPQEWMKGKVGKADGPDTKSRVQNAAIRQYPQATLFGPKGGYISGRGDALMIADYIRQRYVSDEQVAVS